MATQINQVEDHNHCHNTKRISWSAILTGALVGVGLSFLLNLFGVTIGLSAFSMSEQGVGTLAVGGLLGLIISTILAMYFAGYTAGYIGRLYVPKHNMAIIYGFTTWTVAVILSAVLTSHIGSYIDTYSTTITRNTVVVTPAQPIAAKSSQPSVNEEQPKMTPAIQKEISGGMAIGAFIVFALFFVGAISSCLGAHRGMCRKCND